MVEVTSLKFYDEYTGTAGGGTDYLIGSVGDRITAKIQFSVHWETLNVPASFTASTKTITRTDGLDNVSLPSAFAPTPSFINDGFKVGDTIVVSGSGSNDGTYTIASLTDLDIVVNETLIDESALSINVYGNTQIKGIDFWTNLVENNSGEDFHSLVDNETNCKLFANNLDASSASDYTLIPATNSKGWINWHQGINTPKVTAVSWTGYEQKFEITHTFYITPFFLAGQLYNLQKGLPPAVDYFKNSSSLKYIFRIDAKFDWLNPDIPHTSDPYTFPQGNTAWFGEFLNGYDAEYYLTSINYTDVATGNTVTEIDPTRQIDVEIMINGTNFTDAVGYYPGSPMAVNICYLPENTSDYINTTGDLDNNFLHDRAFITIGAAAIDGEYYGDNEQQITNITATYIDSQNVKINFRYDASAYVQQTLLSKDTQNRSYLIWVTPQETCANTTDLNRNAVICDVNSYITNLDDATLFNIPEYVKLYEYPNTPINQYEFYTNYNGFITDTVIANVKFGVKYSPGVYVQPSNVLKSLEVKIIATDGTNEFELQRQGFNLENTYDQDGYSQIDTLISNQYQLSDTDYRNITFLRVSPGNDFNTIADSYHAYELNFPFKLRHEYWRKLQQYNNAFVTDHTQKWSTYSNTLLGWNIKLNIYASVYDPTTDHTTDFIHVTDLGVFDESYDPDTTCMIETFNEAGTITGNLDIFGEENTLVKASFTGDFSSMLFPYTEYYGILYIDNDPVGGITYIDECTTLEAPISTSKWMQQATFTKVNNNLIEITGIIDYTKLTSQTGKYNLYARLGYYNIQIS